MVQVLVQSSPKRQLLFMVALVFSLGCGQMESPVAPVTPSVSPTVDGTSAPPKVSPIAKRTPRPPYDFDAPTRTPRPSPKLTPPQPSPRPTAAPVPSPTWATLPAATPTASPTPPPFVAPVGWTLYINKACKYAIYYPPGWIATEFGGPDRVDIVSADADAAIAIAVSFRSKSLDEWIDEELGKLAVRLWEFRILSKEQVSNGTLVGWKIGYTGRPPGSFPHHYIDLFVSDGAVSFHVSAQAGGNFPMYSSALNLAIQSFEMRSSMADTPTPWWYIGE